MMHVDLRGQVVVITGAGGRLGQRLVHRFARQGARIAAIVLDEDEARRIPFPEDEQAEGYAFPVDVTREELVETCFDQIAHQFGRLDALVHTVGAWDSRPLLGTSLDDWEHLMRINLTSSFLCFREAVRVMQRTGTGGRLIGIAAGQGADRGQARQSAYSAAKAGVIRLVESVAAELAGSGITAHAIAPSTILYDAAPGEPGVAAEQIVSLCLYLCTPAGKGLNGATLRAYGAAGPTTG
ncbi:MAG: SDR family oxidoreductase [Bacteroidetes bacterium]|nr:MAG: SDR family oxidoreductase [Bacteroidota bacterium]